MPEPSVPLFDIRLGEDDIQRVEDTLRSGWLTMGPRTQQFESEFAQHLGVRHAIAVSSGTAALHLAFLAAGVGPGDEVLVPAFTFVASANAVRYCGATPVLCDIRGPADLGVDPADVEARITPRTKAVCVVHYAGYAGPVEELAALCERRGLALIEDAAHAPSANPLGTERKVGSYGTASAFSFFSNKVLSCGEGGLLATNDDDVAAHARRHRSHAMTTGTWDRHRGHALSYDVTGLGFNYRIDEPRAALLSSRLGRLEGDIEDRRAIVRSYRRELGGEGPISLPYSDEEVETSSCYVMPVVLDDPELQEPLRTRLADTHGVQTSLLYPSISEFLAYTGTAGSVPRSELAARTEVTLPLFPHMTEGQLDRVLTGLAESLRALGSPSI